MTTVDVSLAFRQLDDGDLATFGEGTVVGLTGAVASFATPTVPPATVTGQVATLRGTIAKRTQGDRSTSLTAQEVSEANDLRASLTTNAHYVSDTSNALGKGDPAKIKQYILSSGYGVRGQATPAAREFEFAAVGATWAHVRTKKAQTGPEGHLWRYGITATKGTPPTTLITRFGLAADFIFTDLPPSAIIGVQHASILPTPRAAKGVAAAAKGSSASLVSPAGHPTASHLVADPYVWTGFIYALIG